MIVKAGKNRGNPSGCLVSGSIVTRMNTVVI